MNAEKDIQQIFQKLKENYKVHLTTKKTELEKILSDIENDEFDKEALIQTIHKLAGSAGIYGFQEISRVAAEIEFEVSKETVDKIILLKLFAELKGKMNEV